MKQIRKILIILIILNICFLNSAFGLEFDTDEYLEAAGTLKNINNSIITTSFAKYGDYIYVAGKNSNIQIISVSNVSSPEIVGEIDNTSDCTQLEVCNESLITIINNKVISFDIRIPNAPILLGEPNSGANYALAGLLQQVNSEKAVVGHIGGWQVLNIGTPGAVTQAMDYSSNNKSTKAGIATDSTLYRIFNPIGTSTVSLGITTNFTSLRNIASRTTELDISSLYSSTEFRGCQLIGNYLYIAGYNNSDLTVFDVSDAKNPYLVTRRFQNDMSATKACYFEGNYAYFIYKNNMLQILDISDPQNMEQISLGSLDSFEFDGEVKAMKKIDGIIYILTTNDLFMYKTKSICDITIEAPIEGATVTAFPFKLNGNVNTYFGTDTSKVEIYIKGSIFECDVLTGGAFQYVFDELNIENGICPISIKIPNSDVEKTINVNFDLPGGISINNYAYNKSSLTKGSITAAADVTNDCGEDVKILSLWCYMIRTER